MTEEEELRELTRGRGFYRWLQEHYGEESQPSAVGAAVVANQPPPEEP